MHASVNWGAARVLAEIGHSPIQIRPPKTDSVGSRTDGGRNWGLMHGRAAGMPAPSIKDGPSNLLLRGTAAMTDRSHEIPQDLRNLVRLVSACTLGLWAFAAGLLIGVFLFS